MISVCMATYNGEAYLKEQIESILENITEEDELIISDDGSCDHTLDIVKNYMDMYPNIRFVKGPQKGVIKNFESAIRQAKGEYIFLSDQDDIWESDKVEKVLACFQNNKCQVVVHDACIIDGEGRQLEQSFYALRGSRAGLLKNLIKNSYLGCCMAFSAEITEKILPFPEKIEMHDWWIGLVADTAHASVFISDSLVRYRRHDHNVSHMYRHPVKIMIENRIRFIVHLLIRMPGWKKR